MGTMGIQPSEFWRMTPFDFWLIHDGKMRQHAHTTSRMTQDEYEELREQVEDVIREKGLE